MRRLLIVVVLALAVPCLALGQTPAKAADATQISDAQRAEIEKALTAAWAEVLAGLARLSNDGWVKYLSNDFQDHVAGGNVVAQGKEAFLKRGANVSSQRASQKFEPDAVKVYVISPESAYILTFGAVSITQKSGRRGGWGWASTSIWRKEADGWKVVHFHESVW